MATYKEIQKYIQEKHSLNIETCWIADVKEMHGLVDTNKDRKKPCPSDKITFIEDAFRYFGILS